MSLSYSSGELVWGNVKLHEAAKQWGTPAYLYNREILESDFFRIKNVFEPYVDTVCCSVKSNANSELLKILGDLGAGADIVSIGELSAALNAGIRHERIVFAGAGKTDQEIHFAIKSRLLAITVESEEELKVIENFANNMLQKQPVLLRVNPDINAESHPYISTGCGDHKFGIDIDKIENLACYCYAAHSLHFLGLHFHIGSQIEKIEPIGNAFSVIAELIEQIEKRCVPVSIVNIGGGFPADYSTEYNRLLNKKIVSETFNVSEVIQNWSALIPRYFDHTKHRIIIEPGRAVTARSGIMLTKVLYKKIRNNKIFIIVDAASNDFVRPLKYGAFHGIVPLKESGGNFITADVVGPICETGDFLARDIIIPDCSRGDYLAVLTAGAYGFSETSNSNMRLKPVELLIENNSIRCIRPRQQYNDLM